MKKYDGVMPDMPLKDIEAALVDELIHALRHRPEDFTKDQHTLLDRLTREEWWIANGIRHIRIWKKGDDPFHTWARWRAWWHIRRWERIHNDPQKKHRLTLTKVLMNLRVNNHPRPEEE